MLFFPAFVKVSVVLACGGASFLGVQGYMGAKPETTPHAIAQLDPIAALIAESDLTGTMPSLSPIYPTIKYTLAQLSVLPAQTFVKAKVAVRRTNGRPMQIAYSGAPPVSAHDRGRIVQTR